MQKNVLGHAILVAVLAIPSLSHANSKVNINISNNGENSNNSIKVNSNTSSNSKDQGSSETHIIIDSNGERKEYHGSDESVHLESNSGNSRVTINNGTNTNTTPKPSATTAPTSNPTTTPTASPTPTVQPTAYPSANITINGQVLGTTTTKNETDPLFEYLKYAFTSFFNKFF